MISWILLLLRFILVSSVIAVTYLFQELLWFNLRIEHVTLRLDVISFAIMTIFVNLVISQFEAFSRRLTELTENLDTLQRTLRNLKPEN